MRVLLTIPHVFAPREGSLYSSQTEEKRELKQQALRQATLGNLARLGPQHWIHASLGLRQPVVTRQLSAELGVDLSIQLYTPPGANLAGELATHPQLECIDPVVD